MKSINEIIFLGDIMNIEKIKNLREELEITQEEISKVLGCTRTAYSLWEINKNTIPLYYLNKISNVYNINIDYLVDISNEKYITFEKKEIDNLSTFLIFSTKILAAER